MSNSEGSDRMTSALRFAGISLLRGRELRQIIVEPVHALLPELAVLFEPFGRLLQGGGFQMARTPLSFSTPFDQPRAFQHFQVLGYRRRRYCERLGELFDCRFSQYQSSKNCAPGWVR